MIGVYDVRITRFLYSFQSLANSFSPPSSTEKVTLEALKVGFRHVRPFQSAGYVDT
jgi:hypothetical protein